MTPCQKLLKQEGTARRIESMQQSSATPSSYIFGFWGLRKIVACSQSSSQCLLVSTVFGTVSSLHPTSFLMIFTLVLIMTRRSFVTFIHVHVNKQRFQDTLEQHIQHKSRTPEEAFSDQNQLLRWDSNP